MTWLILCRIKNRVGFYIWIVKDFLILHVHISGTFLMQHCVCRIDYRSKGLYQTVCYVFVMSDVTSLSDCFFLCPNLRRSWRSILLSGCLCIHDSIRSSHFLMHAIAILYELCMLGF